MGFSLPSQAVYYRHNSFLLCDFLKNYFLIFLRLHRHFITVHPLLVLPFIFSLLHLELLFCSFCLTALPGCHELPAGSLVVLAVIPHVFVMTALLTSLLTPRGCWGCQRCQHTVASQGKFSLVGQHNDLEATGLAKILMYFCFSRIFMDL